MLENINFWPVHEPLSRIGASLDVKRPDERRA